MNFYYTDQDGNVAGPVTRAQLQQSVDTGLLPPTTQVCYEGSEDWQAISTYIQPSKASVITTPPPVSKHVPAVPAPPKSLSASPLKLFTAIALAIVVSGGGLMLAWQVFFQSKDAKSSASNSPEPQVSPEQEQSLLIEAEKLAAIGKQLTVGCFHLAEAIEDEKKYGNAIGDMRGAVNKGFALTAKLREELESQLRVFKTKLAYMPKTWIGQDGFSALPAKWQNVLDRGDDPWKTPGAVGLAQAYFDMAKEKLGK